MRHIRGSDGRAAMETLLAAASTVEPTIPRLRADPWRTIARVGRTRLAASYLSRHSGRAERLLTVGSVVAEGSPASLRRLALTAFRRRKPVAAAVGPAGRHPTMLVL